MINAKDYGTSHSAYPIDIKGDSPEPALWKNTCCNSGCPGRPYHSPCPGLCTHLCTLKPSRTCCHRFLQIFPFFPLSNDLDDF